MSIRFERLRSCVLAASMAVFSAVQADGAARQTITGAQLLISEWSGGLVANSAFMPAAGAAAAHAPFLGTLKLSESQMNTDPADLVSASVLGRSPKSFPGVSLSFFTYHGDLVPFTQEVLRRGSMYSERSFWDIIVQPGQVWSEPQDGDWSRAAFPFALVNSLEGETHNGLATFLYKQGRVSNLRIQVVQQTAPFYVKDYFTAAALIPAVFAPAGAGNIEALMQTYAASLAEPVRIARWSELSHQVGAAALEGFDGTQPAKDVVLSGLDYQGVFYLKECQSAAGPLPWCDRARFGVWSATKVLATETALLRLAQKYGPAVFDLKISDYVPEAAVHPGWRAVSFENAIDMATGIGNGTDKSEPNDTNDGYLDASYFRWYEARSVREKIAVLLEDGRLYPWGPGKVTRYRDQDMFMLGVAMDRFLKSKQGPSADIWSMLENEVFRPIGIRYAPVNRTLELDGSEGQPLMAYGYYPTIGDMVRLARLYQSGGRQGATQILYGPRIRDLAAGPKPRGLPTGEKLSLGETTYLNAFWMAPYQSGRCRLYYPRMIGWGGNIVALMPGGLTGIRLSKSAGTSDNAEVDTAGMARVADRLIKFCH